MESDERFPLPTRQYRWYVLFFHVLTLGSLAGALADILGNARHSLGWSEVAVCVLLLAQIGIYLGIMLFGRQWPLPRNRLLLYFAVNLAIWLIEYWLAPEVYWVVFAYIGQLEVDPSFTILFVMDSAVSQSYAVQGLPTSYLIDKKGNIRFRAIGGREFDHPEVEKQIMELINE